MISLFGSIYSTIVYFKIFNISCDIYNVCILYVYMSIFLSLYIYICMHIIYPVQSVHCHLYACFPRLTVGANVLFHGDRSPHYHHFFFYHCSLISLEISWTLPVHSHLHIGLMFGKSCW